MERYYTKIINEFLQFFPCVIIVGVRQCGKTTFLKNIGGSWNLFDLERIADFELISRDPDLFFRLNPDQVIIDEAQQLPSIFPALRVAIDQQREKKGRFILTGSSSPQLISSISETLAGRVAIIEMAPFSFAEVTNHASCQLSEVLSATLRIDEIISSLKPKADIALAHDFWFRGGYPEPWVMNTSRFTQLWMEQYFQSYIRRDIAKLFPNLDHNKFSLFIQLLANLSGNVLNYSEIARALAISQPTVRDYLSIAHGSFIWRTIPAYEKNSIKRIVKHPRGYFRDSGLLHHLLKIPSLQMLLTNPLFGRSWEGMVIEEIIRGFAASGYSVDYYYYRTGAGAEVDLVLEGNFGIIPIEIKYSQTVNLIELRSLDSFINERGCSLGIVINNDEKIRKYTDKIVGIPFCYM